MSLTKAMREQYAMRPYGHRGHCRYPAGGEDVLRLCTLADHYREIIEWAERNLPVELQNELRNKLWMVEHGRR